MTYAQSSNIAAADYNTFAGTSDVTTAYASSVAATQKVAALLGVGYGDRGYGQTTPLLTALVAGANIAAAPWLDLRSAIATIASFQGTATTLLPPTTEFVATTGSIKAEVPATTAYDLATMISNIDTNRFNNNGGASLSATVGSLNITRATTWGQLATGQIQCEMTATFASENAARFFFNSSGAIDLVLSHANTSTSQDQNWNTILAALGTISVGAKATTRSGSGGTPVAIGYYGLTSAYQTVFNGTNIGTGNYSANDVLVEAMATGIVGLNGANGTAVKIRVTLVDQHANTNYDVVQLGTKAAFGFKKAAVSITGIASPTLAQVTAF